MTEKRLDIAIWFLIGCITGLVGLILTISFEIFLVGIPLCLIGLGILTKLFCNAFPSVKEGDKPKKEEK